jgi:P-type Ca2+ transporter type 2C
MINHWSGHLTDKPLQVMKGAHCMQGDPGQTVTGLTSDEVASLQLTWGSNELPRARKAHPIRVLLRQFTGLLVVILIIAAAIAFHLGERIDALAIAMVILLNGALGFVQEWRAETALEALRSMMSPTARVIRDGMEQTIPARELVPDDHALLRAGDKVPADLRLVQSIQLSLDESVLTGESAPVRKSHEGGSELAFAGTAVVEGRGAGVVTAIGPKTEFGQIATLTGKVAEKQTHLQRQLGRMAGALAAAAMLIAVTAVSVGLSGGRELSEVFMIGLSLAVAIVPEGLPAVVTITLALGATAMARQNAIVRRLQAVETLGAASVICTDKTGTLTENQMTATKVWMPHAALDVTGTGHDPAGHLALDGRPIRAADDPCLEAALRTAIICSHARLMRDLAAWRIEGEPTEAALVTLAYKGWVGVPEADIVLHENAFTSARKRMSVLARDPLMLHCKGAPEQVLDHCTAVCTPKGQVPMDAEMRKTIHAAYHALASKGLRVMALAQRTASNREDIEERDLVLSALVGIIDPPRAEVKAAIALARDAGIRTVMITGDGPATAMAIARQLDIPASVSMTGTEVDAATNMELQAILAKDTLFARTKPAHKMRIISALQAQGLIVAMTGDGVNDAPALKQADIGVAMGRRGTEVARDAADLVLLDDNYATIVAAIREGRRQFDNVRKFVRYLLSSNAGEIVAILTNIVIGGPLIFLATQILWMNMVTDSITAVALGLEKSEPDQMRRPPIPVKATVLGIRGMMVIALFAAYTGTASLWIFYELLPLGVDLARTAAFTGMIVFEKVSVFAFRSLDQPCMRIGWLSNPVLMGAVGVTLLAQVSAVYWEPLQRLLHTVPLSMDHWVTIGLFAVPLIVVPELAKFALPRRTPPNGARPIAAN